MKYDMIRTRFLEISNFGERRRNFCDWKSKKTGGKENEKEQNKENDPSSGMLVSVQRVSGFRVEYGKEYHGVLSGY